MDVIKFVEDQLLVKKNFLIFCFGDNIVVSYKIVEGDKECIQDFCGDVIKIKGYGSNLMFIVWKIFSGIGVECIFLIVLLNIVDIKVLKCGKVCCVKLYYLCDFVGKKVCIKECVCVK